LCFAVSETLCGNGATEITQIYEWYKCFRDGRSSVNDNSRCGRTSTSTNNASIIKSVSKVVWRDRQERVQMTTAVGMSARNVRKDLNMPYLLQIYYTVLVLR
jgi:hypothetical protein